MRELDSPFLVGLRPCLPLFSGCDLLAFYVLLLCHALCSVRALLCDLCVACSVSRCCFLLAVSLAVCVRRFGLMVR